MLSRVLPRSFGAVALVGVLLASSMPSVAVSASTDAATRPVVIAVDNPGLAKEPQVEVAGTLQAVIADDGDGPGELPPPTSERSEAMWSLVTDSGESVQISSDDPDLSPGASFEGTIAVAPSLESDLSDEAIAALGESSATDPVPADAAVADEIIAAAAQSDEPSVLGAGTIQVAAADTSGTIADHRVTIVVVSPPGVTLLDESLTPYSDSTLVSRVRTAAEYWTNSRIPSFTVDSTVTRVNGSGTCADLYPTRWQTALSALGFDTQEAFQGSAPGMVRHLLIVVPKECAADQPGVLAQLGSSIHDGGIGQVIFGWAEDAQTTAQALGHNLSIGPANIAVCDDDAVSLGCWYAEGLDGYDVMGVHAGGYDSKMGVLNARSQVELGLASVQPAYDFALASGESSRSWDVTVGSLVSGVPSSYVRVADPLTGEPYFLELRINEQTVWSPYGWGIGGDGYTVSFGPGIRLVADGPENGTDAIAIPYGSSAFSFREFGTTDPYFRTQQAIGPSVRNPFGTIIATMTSLSTDSATVHLELRRPDTTDLTPIYRFWSPENRSHFYTASLAERDHIIATYSESQWTYEGEAYTAFSELTPDRVPLYRFWSPTFRGHFFTTNPDEKDFVIENYPPEIWTYENIAYYVYPEESTAPFTMTVARFWSDQNRHHFYTANADEREHVIATYRPEEWTYEGNNFRVPGF